MMASMAYSTWNSRPSGEKVFTPRSYSVLQRPPNTKCKRVSNSAHDAPEFVAAAHRVCGGFNGSDLRERERERGGGACSWRRACQARGPSGEGGGGKRDGEDEDIDGGDERVTGDERVIGGRGWDVRGAADLSPW